MDKWIKYGVYKMEYYSTKERKYILTFITSWMDLESIMFSEVKWSETEKRQILYDLTHMSHLKKKNVLLWHLWALFLLKRTIIFWLFHGYIKYLLWKFSTDWQIIDRKLKCCSWTEIWKRKGLCIYIYVKYIWLMFPKGFNFKSCRRHLYNM